ncbi:T5orf172 domain-containing protein [Diaminobutyricimonas aerilata]|uniref:T5orf172 domain-containing protein n=1 Tax=Diaminobutyricimonas aerilata TaxID=1162967 RepID=A0A2M9CEX7_9MICO|nr:GIY-YIG nuclease family protein [Diaminobutyricimonas aerilata]PJJ70506.1 T5orf172 domain-containing protein [Diaminobutyricimonas aerilata]
MRGTDRRCAAVDCPEAAESGAPAPLCAAHSALVAEWAQGEAGTTDVLPSPCLVCGSRTGVRYPGGWVCAVCEWRHGEVPDGDLAPPRVDVVYYIRFDDRIKIGTTANPRQRLGRLWHDQLLAFERGGRAVEQRRHAQFARYRFDRTEWFRVDDELEHHIRIVANGEPDAWAVYARWTSEALALRG